MNDYTRVVVLCEDRQQEVFARHFLMSCGIDKHRIYTDLSPKGKGSGEEYVRREYPRHVKSYRRLSKQQNAALVVIIDADCLEIDQRLSSLAAALKEAGESDRNERERIGIFVPKRNIETWIYHLMGRAVNEEEAYPPLQKPSDCKSLVQELARNRHQPLGKAAPPSLERACAELSRILPE